MPNTTVEFLPAHLGYLKSYFRQKPMNLLFPFSATLSTLLTAWLVHKAALGDPALVTGFVLVATLAALGVIEHCSSSCRCRSPISGHGACARMTALFRNP